MTAAVTATGNRSGATFLYYLVQTQIRPPVLTSWRQCRVDCARAVPGSAMLSYGSRKEYDAITVAVQGYRRQRGLGPYPPGGQAFLYLGASDEALLVGDHPL
ncbi:hypothetical protein GPECTOR_29g110 [Gonium pectorale]|uniref:Uncharacterized protein n=1 Tax=Gonium pectorale TaxID=33097 RepID=A0A150GEE6_GONPE|nr:hypothetical protein GPECTOR_29g110 [Gonium pectorale]|eukprot:KXZ48204.1 hypothetical protein GPECTOR_29g110 [Gonium pectorale]